MFTVCCLQSIQNPSVRLAHLAKQLKLPIFTDIPSATDACFYLSDKDHVLQLQPVDGRAGGALFVDFASAQADYRRQTSGIKQEIAKAVGCKADVRPSVLDITAGLGGDAFVLASVGCEVTLIERNPIIYSLLEDGLSRALNGAGEAASIVHDKLNLLGNMDALAYLQTNNDSFDVVYLDPMFPERKKSAKVKKAMQYFHHIVGMDAEQELALFDAAIKRANKRVVIKRPKQAPLLAGMKPTYQLKGKSIRYDIYLN